MICSMYNAVAYLADDDVELLARMQDFVELHLADGRAHGGHGVLLDGVDRVLAPVRSLSGVVELAVDVA